MATVASYVVGKRLRGQKQYPLVLMLEPLFRCTLACAGCGKIQYPPHLLLKQLSVDDCLKAVDECGAPMVSIPGGEPLMHPQIKELVEALVARKKYIYLCTNAMLLEKHLDDFKPSKYLTFSVHLDGPREVHDFCVCRDGVYDTAVAAMKAAIAKGFRVTTNTTLFEGADLAKIRQFFDDMMAMGVEGMMISPGYSYDKAADQDHFLHRKKTQELFRDLLKNRKKHWMFNLSPLFLRFLQGDIDFDCTPWGSPTYCMFGWQRPCYLIQDGYAETFKALMEQTKWEQYGRKSGNPKCQDCMMHCGYEPTAVALMFGSSGGFVKGVRAYFGNGA
jgi:hopanoid biosynthesis associated radical SAM protein HpnH